MNHVHTAEGVPRRLTEYVDTLAVPGAPKGRYRYHASLPPTRWASAYVALIKGLLGDLDGMPLEQKGEWISYLQQGQDEASGLFLVGCADQRDISSSKHSVLLLKMHASSFINGALHLLGEKPRYPVNAVHFLREKGAMNRYLEELPWQDPWLVGNYTYDIASLLGVDFLVTGNQGNLDAMHAFFSWHEKHQSTQHGFWDPGDTGKLPHVIYGGYHTLMAYWMYDQKVRWPEKMIATALAVFRQNRGSAGCCQDMDLVDTAVSLTRQYNEPVTSILAMLQEIYPSLLSLQNKDGGFCNNRKEAFSDFGWRKHAVSTGESALTSSYFNLFTLSLLQEVIDIGLRDTDFSHHGYYCHGVRPRGLL